MPGGAREITPDQQPHPSLADERRERTCARIRRATMEVVARRGFDATVDEIAQVAGVSARTIFRHYASRDRLIVETVRDMFEESGRYYDPATGQFLSVDPALDLTGQPYQYVGDDPVNANDPLGLWGWNPIADVVQAAKDVGHHWRGIAQGVEIGGAALASAGCIAATAGVCGTVVGTVLTVGGIGGITGAGFYSASSGDHTLGGYAKAFGIGAGSGVLSAGCALSVGTLCATAAGGFLFNSLVGAGIGAYGYESDTCQPRIPGFIQALLWGAIQNEPVPVPDSWLP
jgi:hypothetical protein